MNPTPVSNLQQIRATVRRITKSPSQQQMTDAEINLYINTFFFYDLPEELRLKSLFTNYSFITQPNQADYPFQTNPGGDGAIDYYVGVEPPLYIDGRQSYFTQDQSTFFNLYEYQAIETNIGTGDGGNIYNLVIPSGNLPALPGQVSLCVGDGTGRNFTAQDLPNDPFDNLGIFVGDGITASSINYVTGAVSLTYSFGIPNGEPILIKTIPYTAGRPSTVLFYNNIFSLRPVPDGCYQIKIAAYRNPLNLLDNLNSSTPEIKQWWQMIALGACLQVFRDRGEMELYAQYYPLYDKQMRLALRRTLNQQSSQATATIYDPQISNNPTFQGYYF